jgi:hypothetical protein
MMHLFISRQTADCAEKVCLMAVSKLILNQSGEGGSQGSTVMVGCQA